VSKTPKIECLRLLMKVAHILQENLEHESFRGCCFHESWCNPPHKVCTFVFSSSSLIFTNNIAYSTELVLETGGVSIAPPARTHTTTTTSTLPPPPLPSLCRAVNAVPKLTRSPPKVAAMRTATARTRERRTTAMKTTLRMGIPVATKTMGRMRGGEKQQ